MDLWVEKYRPSTVDGYVFKNSQMKEQVLEWISNPKDLKISIPHILLSGRPGTGKTTLARIICNELKIPRGDIMEINASRENKVDVVRDKIVNFCSTWPIGKYKIIILDEVDGFTQQAQMILRAEIEKHSDTARFILTCNMQNKLIPALHSRMQSFQIDELDMDSFITRVIEILHTEEIDFEIEDIDAFITGSYPDLRKCINTISQHVRNNKLHPLEESGGSSMNYLEEAVELFKQGKNIEARKLITSSAQIDEYDEIYRYFYKNPHLFSNTDGGQDEAIVTIAKGLRNHALVADPEINLAACIIELCLIGK